MKKLQYRIEATLLAFFFRGLSLLPVGIASSLGALIAQAIGSFFSANNTAKKNIAMVFPEMNTRQINQLVKRMWRHLGRVGAEYPFLKNYSLRSCIIVEGAEHFPKPNEKALFFSGHIGNWELLSSVAHSYGVDISLIYRHTNNPYVDKIIADLRKPHCNELIAKGIRGGMRILSALKRGGTVAMLVDQKLNNGIAVPFFGRDAMTSPAIAEIALKYDIPIIPARVIRTGGAHFKVVIYPPLIFEKTGNHKQDVLAVMTQINSVLEGWIREYPEQWFWVHRRWPKTVSP